jgi:hypothetical protein
MLVLTFIPRATDWLWFMSGRPPALTPLLTFNPRVTVWLWFCVSAPASTPLLTFRPRDASWFRSH